jgi:hypothetical protein
LRGRTVFEKPAARPSDEEPRRLVRACAGDHPAQVSGVTDQGTQITDTALVMVKPVPHTESSGSR